MKKFLSLLLVVLMVLPAMANLPFTALAADSPINAASGRFAFISGDPGNATDKLTDGDRTANGSYYFDNLKSNLQSEITDASDNYALIDLGAKYDITSVKISNYPTKPTAAKVYLSNDADAPLAEWTYYGQRAKSSSTTVTVTGDAVCARYVRVYLTYYAYSADNVGTNWGWLSEIAVMGTLASGETEPTSQGKLIAISPRFGKIENYAGRTSFIFSTPTIIGGTEDENEEISKALQENTMTAYYTVTDADTNASFKFRYVPGDVGYEHQPDYGFCRLPVCNFGCDIMKSGHKYTLSLELYDGDTLLYSGSSGKGAFYAPEGSDFELNGPIIPKVVIDSTSPLLGKKIIFMGDSITEAICERRNPETVSTAGWPGRIGSSNGMSWKNVGVSGATISASANSEGLLRSENTVYKQAYANKENTYDLIIMQGGVNDGWFSHPVGKVTADDVRDPSAFDLSTLAGGIEYTFAFMKENYPTAKFGFILTFKMPSSPYGYTSDMDEAYDEVIKACEKWGVPYLDLYHDEEVANRLQPTVNYYALGDYVHPNNRGYDILFPYINAFTKAVWETEGLTGSVTVEVPPYTPVENGAPILPTDVNIAIGKPVKDGSGKTTTSVTNGSKGSSYVVGTCGEDTCYCEIDLCGVYDIDKVNVYSGGYNFLYRFEIRVSMDGENWVTVGAKNDCEMVFPDGFTVGFETVSARYVRVYGLYCNQNQNRYIVGEISVYGKINEELTFAGIDLAAVKPGKVVLPDGKTETTKLTDGNRVSDPQKIDVIEGKCIVIDMKEEIELSRIDFIMAEADSAFSVFGSNDSVNWTKLASKTLADVTSKPSFEVSGKYRYLKVRYDKGRTSISDNLVVFYEIKPYDKNGNLVTGMSAPGYPAAVDGNNGSYCYLTMPQGGIVVDLGDMGTIYKTVLYVTDKRMTFHIQVSADGVNFTTFSGVTQNELYHPADGYVCYGKAYARYIRILPTGYVNDTFSAYELEIFADTHVHNYSGNWISDETAHWKACDSCDEISSYGKHSFKKQVTLKPTVTEEGEAVYTCTECKYSYKETLPPDPLADMEDISTGKDAWLYTKEKTNSTEYLLVSKDGITDGKMNDNWAFGAFGTIYAKIDLGGYYDIGAINVVGYSPYRHAWSVYLSVDDCVYTKVASCAMTEHPEEGVEISVNGEVARYVKIVADNYVTANQFSFREVTVYGIESQKTVHLYNGDWQYDETYHWKNCTLHNEQGLYSTHSYDIGTVTVEPTATTEGEIYYVCTSCGYKKTVVVPINPLAGTSNVAAGKNASLYTKNTKNDENYSLNPCAGLTDGKTNDNWAYGNFGEMYALIDLGDYYTVAGVNVIAYTPYNHAWTVYVSTDNISYVRAASVESTAHPVEGVTVDFTPVTARYIKVVADYYVTPQQFSFREVEVYGTEGSLGDHHYSTEWSYNQNKHWKICTDDGCTAVTATADHVFGEPNVTVEPSETSNGEKIYTCTVCGAVKKVVIPMITEEPTNVALNKKAWLYTKNNIKETEYILKECSALTDANRHDNWTYGDFGVVYALIDLGAVYNVTGVNVVGYAPYNHAWSVYVSENGENYMKVGSVDRTAHPENGLTLEFAPVGARYVKIVADYYVTANQFSFREVEVYGVLADVPTVDIASSATVTLPDGTVTDILTNGNYNDLITSGELTAGNVLFDLGSAEPITSIYLKTAEKGCYYRIYGSEDGINWVVLAEKEYHRDENEITYAVNGDYRYIKVQGYGVRSNKDGYANTISEIDLFNGDTEYTDLTVTSTNVVYGGNANDGKYDNYSFYRQAKYITVDLGEITDVRKVVLFVPEGFYSAMVEYSEDGVNYKTLDVADTLKNYNPAKGLVLAPNGGFCMARYLRVSSCGSADDTMKISEIRVYSPGEEDTSEYDLNGDGAVDISDVTTLLNYLATSTGEYTKAYDLNNDSNVDISDVTALLNYLATM